MSILCTHLPNLLLSLTHQANPHMVGKPLVILDEAERITALSPEAASDGVTPGSTYFARSRIAMTVYFSSERYFRNASNCSLPTPTVRRCSTRVCQKTLLC